MLKPSSQSFHLKLDILSFFTVLDMRKFLNTKTSGIRMNSQQWLRKLFILTIHDRHLICSIHNVYKLIFFHASVADFIHNTDLVIK